MMNPKDSTLLAYTKLRTRKIRLFFTVAISGLLLGGLATAAFVVRGGIASIESFNSERFGNRYILSASPLSSGKYLDNSEVAERAISIQKEIVAKKKAAAKKLNIDYDSSTEQPVYTEYDGQDGKKVKSADSNTAAGKQAIEEYLQKHAEVGLKELKEVGQKYNVKAYYQSPPSALMDPNPNYIRVLKDGKEDFENKIDTQNPYMQTGTDSFATQWGLISQDLLKPFLLPGSNTEVGKDGSYPVVAPYLAVEQLLKLKPLPATATKEQKLERIRQVREGAKDLKFAACYRNTTNKLQLDEAINQQKTIKAEKGKKGYVQPKLINDLPKTACGDPVTTRDVRGKSEKQAASNQREFNRQFGAPDPESKTLTFRIVGVAADPPNFANAGASQLITGILASNISNNGLSWYTPLEVADANPDITKVVKSQSYNYATTSYFVELSDVASAKKMLKDENCQPDFNVSGPGNTKDPYEACNKKGKLFTLTAFGSSSLALDDIKTTFAKVFSVASLIFAGIAAVIMIGTVGRIIADSRRETSVFRAIGAKRLDIAQIYFTYSILLAMLVFAFTVVMGLVIANWLNGKFGTELTVNAIVVFNAQDLTRKFSLVAIEGQDLLRLLLVTIAAGLISTVLPLATNLRRSPIKDMRDEN